MRRVLGIGVALGLAAALISRCGGDDEFCDLANGNGLVAGPLTSDDERAAYRNRLDDAAEVAPAEVAGAVEVLRDAARSADGPAKAVRAPALSDDRADIDDWTGENCA